MNLPGMNDEEEIFRSLPKDYRLALEGSGMYFNTHGAGIGVASHLSYCWVSGEAWVMFGADGFCAAAYVEGWHPPPSSGKASEALSRLIGGLQDPNATAGPVLKQEAGWLYGERPVLLPVLCVETYAPTGRPGVRKRVKTSFDPRFYAAFLKLYPDLLLSAPEAPRGLIGVWSKQRVVGMFAPLSGSDDPGQIVSSAATEEDPG